MFDKYEPLIYGFVDSLEIFKNLLPGRKTYKLEALADNYGISTIGAHNALADVKMLSCILTKHPVIEMDLIKYMQTLANYVKIAIAQKDLSPLDSVISEEMKKRMVNTDMTMALLQKTFAINNYEGIAELFSEKVNGKVRVSKARSVIKKVADFLANASIS
ncbi:uncharacterized protein LOC131667539 [Phymastichus coffea]|uniref:uncharacterized protein LOC131667539 n=1 Tax=Phymastichus coffea TaxID=108790 RepID=UPI00273CCE3E|nr:uncharacterized protein LOC131667539 [Phymastichus coffea]